MAMLMAVRRMKTIVTRYQVQDYSLLKVRGRELCRMTVGVVGTGQIGETVIRNLSGFGCRILANDVCEKEAVKELAAYTDLETIWRECDIVTFHTPALPETYHLVSRESLAKMKPGVGTDQYGPREHHRHGGADRGAGERAGGSCRPGRAGGRGPHLLPGLQI